MTKMVAVLNTNNLDMVMLEVITGLILSKRKFTS
jgi:hypothetical protein